MKEVLRKALEQASEDEIREFGFTSRDECASFVLEALRDRASRAEWEQLHKKKAPDPEKLVDQELRRIADWALRDGLVFFLGAGVSAGAPQRRPHDREARLPGGAELARLISSEPLPPRELGLARIAESVELLRNEAFLYDQLREIFRRDYEPQGVHTKLATLPRHSLERQGKSVYPQIFTTNYDRLMERAFEDLGVPFIVYFYDDACRAFRSFDDNRLSEPLKENDLVKVSVDRATIVKLHGTWLPEDGRDRYVISESDYIESLGMDRVLPLGLKAMWQTRRTVFLGYGLEDWTVRKLLFDLWSGPVSKRRHWAVQLSPSPLDRMFWLKFNDVVLYESDVTAFMTQLELIWAERR
jgi:hypothetical protein